MSNEKVPMTVLGKKMLEDEHKHLVSVERPTIIKAIEHARSNGDLSENADYSAAKERQGFIEGRIQEINAKLAASQVIDPKLIKSTKIVFGATVILKDVDRGEEIKYQIVGVDEANIKIGKIGVTSPIARAMIGKSEGEEVEVNAPRGKIQYEVVEVRYE